MSTVELPEGFIYVSRWFECRFNRSRFFGRVTQDPRVLPELSLFDSAEEQKKKLAQHERHLRKLMARIRRDDAIKGKSWKVSFDELWSKPGRKPPVAHERSRVRRRLRERTKAYAKAHPVPVSAAA